MCNVGAVCITKKQYVFCTSCTILKFLKAMNRIVRKTIEKVIAVDQARIYKSICKCNSSRFRKYWADIAKITKLQRHD